MANDSIEQMRREWQEQWLARKVWAITETPDGQFEVHVHDPEGVAPPSTYPTMRKATARLLQLLGTGIVSPQTWPERVCIGTVSIATEEDETDGKGVR